MTFFSNKEINELEHLYKINLINSCSGYKSANLIGTKSKKGQTNVAVFSSVIHLGSNPPVFGFVMRPTTAARNTFDNIKETGFYTINHIFEDIIIDAHHTSAKYAKETSEFDMTALEKEYKNDFHAPFVKNSPVQMAMKYVEEYHIKVNGTILIVGEIQGLYINSEIIKNDGFVNLSEGKVAAINGLDGYTIPKLKERFPYQRPREIITRA
ncbi:flavin reductase family protein [Urechidicola croceus]|uniref:Flavin oxidoreductase n=1 Tax=Urechidicola croceus TaxID=1850246 RepID=A0A1D8P731_9FLAO|nr:flavin reductase [Urechidicola croceus]AOW20377.1 flavin oxidoreductase [Urechidicola croceus]